MSLDAWARRAATTLLPAAAFLRAWSLRWTADDAFISFRYAKNLVQGHGLVFNAGERVEGYSNFLWTLAAAPALALGTSPETSSWVLGALAHAATVWLLARRTLALPARRWPVAALAFAFHPDAAAFATSGLETGLFTTLALASFLAWEEQRPARAGLFAGLATLTRPDGVVFAAVLLVTTLVERRSAGALRAAARVAGPFLALVGPHVAFRLAYYGNLFPNTYYAKSGGLAWYGQGLFYTWLYLLRYPVLAAAPIVAAALWRRDARGTLGAAAFGLVYVFWVVRVGGDFMFARFLVPATPLLLVVLEDGVRAIASMERRGAAAAGVVMGTALLPCPASTAPDHGIVDERAFYDAERTFRTDARAARIRDLLSGAHASVAFYGAQARLVYRAEIPVAVESHTGLTDGFVARQPLTARGRVGHEKHAPPSYLVDVRSLDLAFPSPRKGGVGGYVPDVRFNLGGVEARLLRWNAPLVELLRSRGVAVPDYPAALDAELDALERIPIAARAPAAHLALERTTRFYFRHVEDEARRLRFERLAAR